MSIPKYATLLLGLAAFFNPAAGQQEKDLTRYAQTLNLDSAIQPDHYRAEISIAEYVLTNRQGRKYNFTIIQIDSVTKLFYSALQQLGFHQRPELVSIRERSSESFQRRRLFEATYTFNLGSQDSISLLYQGLVRIMPEYSLNRIRITPLVRDDRADIIKKQMEARALTRIKTEAQAFADSNHLSIEKIDTYTLSFQLDETDNSYTLENQNNAVLIIFAPPIAHLHAYYAFRLK